MFVWIPLSVPPSSEMRMLLSSSKRESTFHKMVLGSASQEKGKGRESFLHLTFLKFLELKIFNMPTYRILGKRVLSPITNNTYIEFWIEGESKVKKVEFRGSKEEVLLEPALDKVSFLFFFLKECLFF